MLLISLYSPCKHQKKYGYDFRGGGAGGGGYRKKLETRNELMSLSSTNPNFLYSAIRQILNFSFRDVKSCKNSVRNCALNLQKPKSNLLHAT